MRIRQFAHCVMVCLGVVTGCLFLPVGCRNSPSAVPESAVDPAAAAQGALEKYDRDQDGVLTKTELGACPALRSAIRAFDSDQDGSISKTELMARFQFWVESPTRIAAVPCVVYLDNEPIQGAIVHFIPEPFLEGQIAPGAGETGPNGRAIIAASDDDLPEAWKGLRGLQLGLYRVEITHPSVTIPAQYNTETTLGIEVNPATSGAPTRFSVKSK